MAELVKHVDTLTAVAVQHEIQKRLDTQDTRMAHLEDLIAMLTQSLNTLIHTITKNIVDIPTAMDEQPQSCKRNHENPAALDDKAPKLKPATLLVSPNLDS